MSITPQLILSPTIHRAKQIERKQNNPLVQAVTLDNFITEVYKRYGTKRSIDQIEVRYILVAQLKKVKRKYFDYLTPQSEALHEVTALFIDLKRNGISISDFEYTDEKKRELQALFKCYNLFLDKHHLVDRGDIELEVLALLQNNVEILKPFGEIIVDSFEANDIHFESSQLQKKILSFLQTNRTLFNSSQRSIQGSCHFFQPQPAPFNQIDEVAVALKIVRRLLNEGVKAEEIIIVTSAIDEYAPIFESLIGAYNLVGYSSIGVALQNYLPLIKNRKKLPEDALLIQASNTYEQLKSSVHQIYEKMSSLNIDINYDELLKECIDQVRIKDKNYQGIMLTEPNQLLAKEHIDHLIFMGTDMSHFPPKASESFLVTQKQKLQFLHGNSIYLSSKNQYLYMKEITKNLYIVTATYKGKTKLARSLMITELCEDFDVSDYKAGHELLREQKRIAHNDIEPYLDTLQSEEMTLYDGIEVGNFHVSSLSASQLNSYAMCPRRYFMSRILKLKAPQEEDEGFDAMQKGTIMHRCFELFAKAVKADKIELGNLVTIALQNEMTNISVIAYNEFLAGDKKCDPIEENINHQLFIQELQAGLDNKTKAKGSLQNFLHYVIENRERLHDFKLSEFEMEFKMDENYNPIDDDKNLFIRGFIDRIDILEDEIKIVDYKSKKMDKKLDKKKLEQIQNLKDMQLALYILYARQKYEDKKIESYLQTFKSKYGSSEFAKVATFEVAKEGEYVHYDKVFEESLIDRINEIKNSIEKGDFHYDDSDEEQCLWCEFRLMCKTTSKQY